MCPRNATPIVQLAPPPGTQQVLAPPSVPRATVLKPRRASSCAFCCLGLLTSPLPLRPAGNTLGCNLSCPRAPSHRPPCTNSLAPAATRLTPESQDEGGGLAVDTLVIFHIAIQLLGTLAPGPTSTTTWQGHRTAGSDGCCPSAHPPTLLLASSLCCANPRTTGSQPPAAVRPKGQDPK